MTSAGSASKPQISTVRVISAALSVTMLSTLPVFLAGALAVEIGPDFGVDAVFLGSALSLFFTVSAVGSLTLGWLPDRIGWRSGMRVGALASFLSLVGVAATHDSTVLLVLSLGIGGFSMAIGNPSVNLALSSATPAHRRGLIFGIKHSAVPAAALLSGLALPGVALNFGWRSVYWGASVLAVILVAVVPRESSDQRTHRPVAAATAEIRIAPLIFMAVAAAFAAWVASVLSAFLVSSLVDSGFSAAAGGFILALASIAGLTTRIVAGWWADRRSGGLGGVAVLLLVGCGGLLFLTTTAQSLLVLGSVLAFGAGWGWNGLFNFAVVKNYPEAPARATSIALTGTYIGAALGPVATGLVANNFSFRAAWVLTAGFSVFAAGFIMLARTKLRSMHRTGTAASATRSKERVVSDG